MKAEVFQEIQIPDGVEVKMEGDKLVAKGAEGEVSREFNLAKVDFEIKGDKIILGNKKATKREKKKINTMRAHIKNLLDGVKQKFEYRLKACYVHFPMTLEVKGTEVIIKNFLGEKTPRKAKIPHGAEVKIEKDLIKIKAINKEVAGQAAANLEKATKIRNRDRRIFQDGIFITNKCGVDI